MEITNSEAKRFWRLFTLYRGINHEFFELVPEEQYETALTTLHKSDSVQDNLRHLIEVEGCYLAAVDRGELIFGQGKRPDLKSAVKEELLTELDLLDNKLCNILSNQKMLNKRVQVRWSKTPVPVIRMLWGLNDHEVLHNGLNIAFMDVLGIARFPKLKATWG